MDKRRNQEQCERDNAINECIEVVKKTDCRAAKPAPVRGGETHMTKCCALSPVSPAPETPKVHLCDTPKLCVNNFCTKVNNACESSQLTDYGAEFASKTGTTITKCICVKYNGLQDSCQHPGCYTKDGCMDNPFPNCEPAQRWKSDFNRGNSNDDC